MQDFWRVRPSPSSGNSYESSSHYVGIVMDVVFLFQFAETPLMDGLYWEKWYNDRNVSTDELGYIFYENKLLGVPRMRQLKVRTTASSGRLHIL